MSASITLAPNKRIVSLWIAALVVATISVFIAKQMPVANREIFERLMIAFGETQMSIGGTPVTHLNWTTIGGILNIIGFALFSVGETYLTFRLALLPRALTSMSLFCLSLLYQFGLWHLLHVQPHSMGFVSAIVGGFCAGMLLRLNEDRQAEMDRNRFLVKVREQDLNRIQLDLIKQNEIERRMLAADLHDQVLNDLKQINQRFENYLASPDEQNAQAIRQLTNQVMVEIREVMETLSPSVLEHLGLGAAIEECLRRGSDRSGFKVRFKNKLDHEDLDCLTMVEQGILYRLSQESVTNICKHAGASTVRATLDKEENMLVIRMTDDGKGIDPAKLRADSRGMKYQRYRAALVGAIIAWKPGENGKGTTVEISVDLTDRMRANREKQLLEEPKGTDND